MWPEIFSEVARNFNEDSIQYISFFKALSDNEMKQAG